ncbi:Triacylglycerol lipase [Bertholletia excelsa]
MSPTHQALPLNLPPKAETMAGCPSEAGFSKNFVHLKHDQANFLHMFKLLYTKDLSESKLIEVPDKTVAGFQHRFLIFLSILIQKILKAIRTPLALVGEIVELIMNIAATNFFVLIWNFIRGKGLDRDAPYFRSFLANLDKRVDLDKNIKPGDVRYNAMLAMMASKICYENQAYIEDTVVNHWEMEFLGFYNYWNEFQQKSNTQAFLFHDPKSEQIVVAFRGTEPFSADDWSTDIDFSWYELQGMGKAHFGFLKGLGLQQKTGFPRELPLFHPRAHQLAYYHIRDMLRKFLREHERTRVLITGHSLGGALAILFPAILVFHGQEEILDRVSGVITFGQPRVGDKAFGESMVAAFRKCNVPYFRFVYCFDLVPRVPFDSSAMLFSHFGKCMFFSGMYTCRVLDEEPNRNYFFNPLYWIPMKLNALWEIIRGFLLPFMEGWDYKEGFYQKCSRVAGLLTLVGLAAHGPQDYVNSTRLGVMEAYGKAAYYLQDK